MNKPRLKETKAGKGWAWEIKGPKGNWVLCDWAEPYQAVLLQNPRPSPEARMVHVALVPMKIWRKRK